MNQQVKKQSTFDRVLFNEKKMGAYFTDLKHCEMIRSWIDWGEERNVLVLEPSAGDGSAVIAATGAENKNNIFIYAVELDESRYHVLKEQKGIYNAICSDFLKLRMTNKRMDAIFANPPYLTDSEGQRYEKIFLERFDRYLAPNGLLILVIPRHLLHDISKILVNRYYGVQVRRFLDNDEFKEKFGSKYEYHNQVVVFGYKKKNNYIDEEEYSIIEELNEMADFEEKLLPLDYAEEPIYKISSNHNPQSIDLFEGNMIDLPALKEIGRESSLIGNFVDSLNIEGKEVICYHPPIEPRKEHKYFLAICNTDCEVGDEDEGTLHLLRTSVQSVTKVERKMDFDEDKDNKKTGEEVRAIARTSSQVYCNILTANGEFITIM